LTATDVWQKNAQVSASQPRGIAPPPASLISIHAGLAMDPDFPPQSRLAE